MKIHIIDNQKDLKIKKEFLKNIVLIFFEKTKIKCDEISIFLVDKKEISSLHKKYFNDQTVTDCITFPIDDWKDPDLKNIYLGDIFICPLVAKEYAKNHQISYEKELSLYLIHGLLHLIGYNDINKNDIKVMREKEQEFLNLLQEKKIYEH